MGVSTDAILFWGYCWTDEDRLPWMTDDDDESVDNTSDGGQDDPEERYAVACGVPRPTVEFPENEHDNSAKAKAARAEYLEFWDKRDNVYKRAGCKLVYHCSDECTMHGVAITASVLEASRGNPEQVKSLETYPEWEQKLAAFCDKMGINVKKQKPKWWLVSYWG